MTWLFVAVGGAVGAMLRYAVARRFHGVVPWGILVANVVGSLVLGVLVGAAVAEQWQLLLGVGLCGALTTYSALAFDTVVLAEAGERLLAGLYALASLCGGLAAALVGLAVGGALLG